MKATNAHDLIISLRHVWTILPACVVARVKALGLRRHRGCRAGKAHRLFCKQRMLTPADAVKSSISSCVFTVDYTAPSLYVLNAAALTKPHAIDHLAVDLVSYKSDVAVISESHFKAKHSDSILGIKDYILFR